MKNLSWFCTVFLLVLLATSARAGASQERTKPTVVRGEIPFRLFDGFLIVMDGRIGERGKLKFVLDTGVTYSVIDRKLADRIPVPRRLSGEILSFDKTIKPEWIEVPEIEFGPIRMTNFSMMVGDLRYFQSYATHVDAVIGLDLLRLSSFSIDYHTRKVTFGPLNTDSGVPIEVNSICVTVPLMLGDRKVRLIVDTGAQSLILYEDSVATYLPQLGMERETSGISVAGWAFSKRGFIRDATLGSTKLNGTVFLVKRPQHAAFANIDGYLGTAALRAQHIHFNFETNALSWK